MCGQSRKKVKENYRNQRKSQKFKKTEAIIITLEKNKKHFKSQPSLSSR